MSDCKTPQSIAQAQADCPPKKPLGTAPDGSEGVGVTEPPKTTNPGNPPTPPGADPTPSDYEVQARQAQKTIAEGQQRIAEANQALEQWRSIYVDGVGSVILPIAAELEALFAVNDQGIASMFGDINDFSNFLRAMQTSSQNLDATLQRMFEAGQISEEQLKNLRAAGALFQAVGDPMRTVVERLADGIDGKDLADFGSWAGQIASMGARAAYENVPAIKATVDWFVSTTRSVGQAIADAAAWIGNKLGFNVVANKASEIFEKTKNWANQVVADVNATVDFTNECMSLANEFLGLTNGLLQSVCQTINAIRQLITYLATLSKYSVLMAFVPLATSLLSLALPQLRLPGNVSLLLTNVDGLKSQMANTLRNAACLSEALGDQGGSAAASLAQANALEKMGSLRSVGQLVEKFVNETISSVAASILTGASGFASSILASGLKLPPGVEPPLGVAWTLGSKGLQREVMKRPPIAPEKGNLVSAISGIMSTIGYAAALGNFVGTLSTRLNNSWLSVSYRGVASRPDAAAELLAQATLASELNGANQGLGDLANASGACGLAASNLGTYKDEKAGRDAVRAGLQAGALCLAHGNPATRPDGTNPSLAAQDAKCCAEEKSGRKQDPEGKEPPDPNELKDNVDDTVGDNTGGLPFSATDQAGGNNGGPRIDDGDVPGPRGDDPDLPEPDAPRQPSLPPVTMPEPEFDEEGRPLVPGVDGGLARPEDAVSGSNGIRPVDLVESPFLGLPPGFYDQPQRDAILALLPLVADLDFDVERFLLQLLIRGTGERVHVDFLLRLLKDFDSLNFAAGTPGYSLLTKATNQGRRNQSPYTFMVEGALAISSAREDGIDIGARVLVDWLRHQRLDLVPLAQWILSADHLDLEVPIPSDLTAEEEAIAQQSYAFVRDNLELVKGLEGVILMLRKRADVYGGYNSFEHVVVLGILHMVKYLRDAIGSGEVDLAQAQAYAAAVKRVAENYLTNPDLILPVLEGLTA